ncbi:MAG: LLM class flavin-dependent oxidoreductase [Chloroflexi bacterium]|nr:LLM class flavin-dependent oxidoreductase [Chloroflexota bacterium]
MADLTAPIKLGANLWNQYTDWPGFLTAMQRADSLGYESLWTWDHVYPIVGSWQGPILEAYTAMSAVAATTQRATIGLLVGANTFRNPALVAKMMTTIDHISGGRAVLGIGGAWFEEEHTGFGFDFGSGFPERLRWLGQALPIMRGMLDGTEPTVTEGRYRTSAVRNDPAPIQSHLPILIGGTGRKVTLKLTAQYADLYNMGDGDIVDAADVEATLVEHCRTVGRDEREIERTLELQRVVIRDTKAEALRVQDEILAGNGGATVDEDRPGSADIAAARGCVGTVDDVIAHIRPYVELGYRHLICGFPAPYDAESMERMATEVRPRLEALISG